MPKGKHKGKHRVFTSPEQLEEEREREQRAKEWRQKKGEESSDESGSESGSESSSSEEDAKASKPKGPQVAVENPNRVVQKNKKLSSLTVEGATKEPAQLSRREREAIEKEKARQHYQKLHSQGKTAEAQADLARLAIIRKQREEAAKKREEEKKAKEAAAAAKSKR